MSNRDCDGGFPTQVPFLVVTRKRSPDEYGPTHGLMRAARISHTNSPRRTRDLTPPVTKKKKSRVPRHA
eukprot:1122120-Prymnesium_polylepis.1